VGTLIGFSISLCGLPILLKRNFDTPLRLLFGAVIKPLGFGIPYGGFLWWFSRTHTPWGWLGLGMEMIGASLGYGAIAWLLILEPEERDQWYGRIKQIMPQKFRKP
jgi:hypothetical protein